MPTELNNGLFIFTRDLRVNDNLSLNVCCSECKNVYTVFFFTPEQVMSNAFKSQNAVQFMIESLESLEEQVKSKGGKLLVLYSEPNKGVEHLIKALDIDGVFMSQEITPYGRERFDSIQTVCDKFDVKLTETNDYYLTEPASILNSSGEPYVKFTPYASKVLSHLRTKAGRVPSPYTHRNMRLKAPSSSQSKNIKNQIALSTAKSRFAPNGSPQRLVKGGREAGLSKLRDVKKNVPSYEATRNDLEDTTTQLSAYIKFGCVSVREAYHTFDNDLDKASAESLIRQLIWRDFYAQVMFSNPDVLYGPMKEKYGKIKWSKSKTLLDAWKTGTTGFPIVDAGMREMLATGYMHNRARLIVGSFLPKTLLINWQEGEKHFAQMLTDYDPASNNGNWQWVAGTGADSQPYFRILNPFLQSKRYDPNATYIKKWVPELKDISAKDIHNWNIAHEKHNLRDYPAPVVNYDEQKEKVMRAYASAMK